MKPLIEMRKVCKTYKTGEVEVEALRDISFSIAEGEFVIILGASGSGKSTILNILGGLDTVTGGDVVVEGENIVAYKENALNHYRRDKIGFVFQFYNLISNLTALENVEFGAEVHKGHLNAKDVLSSVGLLDRSRNFPSQLSGGEQQRVAIARAVAKNPAILLCDEPTGALDYVTGKKVLALLQEVNRQYGKTVVLITHNSLIAPMADKVITVKSGNIQSVEKNMARVPVEELEW